MKSILSAQLRSQTKDRLRDARFMAREFGTTVGRSLPEPGQPSAKLIGAMAGVSDAAFSSLERAAIEILSSDPEAYLGGGRARPLSRWFAAGGTDESAFARDAYAAAKRLLADRGVRNPRLSEALLVQACRVAAADIAERRRSGDGRNRLEAVAIEAALMAGAVLAARPVKAPQTLSLGEDTPPVDANLYIAAALALAAGIAEYQKDDIGQDGEVFDGVAAALEARPALLEQMVTDSGSPDGLAELFARLIPHLP